MLDTIAAFIAGILSSMGLGGGTILLLYLTIFQNINQTDASGINLIYYIPCALIATVLYFKNKIIAGKDIVTISSGALIGAASGALTVGLISPNILRITFSIYILITGIHQLFKG